MAGAFPMVGAGVVALLAFVVSGAGYRSLLRTGNAAMWWIVAGFFLLGAKNAAKVAFLLTEGSVPLAWEAAFTLADVGALGCIAWPLFARRSPP